VGKEGTDRNLLGLTEITAVHWSGVLTNVVLVCLNKKQQL
jgi:hypothetical protein